MENFNKNYGRFTRATLRQAFIDAETNGELKKYEGVQGRGWIVHIGENAFSCVNTGGKISKEEGIKLLWDSMLDFYGLKF